MRLETKFDDTVTGFKGKFNVLCQIRVSGQV